MTWKSTPLGAGGTPCRSRGHWFCTAWRNAWGCQPRLQNLLWISIVAIVACGFSWAFFSSILASFQELVPRTLGMHSKYLKVKSKRMLSGFLIAKWHCWWCCTNKGHHFSSRLPVLAKLDPPGVGPGPQRYWPTTRIGSGGSWSWSFNSFNMSWWASYLFISHISNFDLTVVTWRGGRRKSRRQRRRKSLQRRSGRLQWCKTCRKQIPRPTKLCTRLVLKSYTKIFNRRHCTEPCRIGALLFHHKGPFLSHCHY